VSADPTRAHSGSPIAASPPPPSPPQFLAYLLMLVAMLYEVALFGALLLGVCPIPRFQSGLIFLPQFGLIASPGAKQCTFRVFTGFHVNQKAQ